MKKVFYGLFFTLFCLIGFTKVNALDNVCFYKTNDEKITFAVIVDSKNNGKAYLMKSYSKGDGFGESQDYASSWSVNNIKSNGKCSPYLLYEMKTGKNKITAHSTKPTASSGQYVLTEYNFINVASKCSYNSPKVDDHFTLHVYINNGSMFFYYNDLESPFSDYKADSGNEYKPKKFYSSFTSSYNNSCPLLYTNSSIKNSSVKDTFDIYYGSTCSKNDSSCISQKGSGNWASTTEENPTNPDDTNIAKEYTKVYKKTANQKDDIKVIFRAYTNKEQDVCFSINGEVNCYSAVKGKDISQQIPIGEAGKYNWLVLKGENVDYFFKYENSNPNSLKDPGVVYFNSLDSLRYEISLTKKQGVQSINSNDASVFGGELFKERVCELSPFLKELKVDDSIELNINGKLLSISKWGCKNTCDYNTEECKSNLAYNAETKVRAVAEYCSYLYDNYYKFTANGISESRLEECISFDEYYNKLVEKGYVRNITGNCDFISQDVYNMLQTALNIIKVAGPILAIALGMIDFAKVIVSGDADKELKQAGQRFLKRIIAAAVLLLLPIILSFLMNIFLKDETGYDSDNPFCNLENMRNLEK